MTFATTPYGRPTWCAGYRRDPHVTDDVRPRKPDALPLCDRCALRRGGDRG